MDSAVSIHAVERYLGDLALDQGWVFGRAAGPSGRRVLVIGAGPSGLSAAYVSTLWAADRDGGSW
jgi:NADPH-dependent glutamate synthase beta subunit-like oxidoreductase